MYVGPSGALANYTTMVCFDCCCRAACGRKGVVEVVDVGANGEGGHAGLVEAFKGCLWRQ